MALTYTPSPNVINGCGCLKWKKKKGAKHRGRGLKKGGSLDHYQCVCVESSKHWSSWWKTLKQMKKPRKRKKLQKKKKSVSSFFFFLHYRCCCVGFQNWHAHMQVWTKLTTCCWATMYCCRLLRLSDRVGRPCIACCHSKVKYSSTYLEAPSEGGLCVTASVCVWRETR